MSACPTCGVDVTVIPADMYARLTDDSEHTARPPHPDTMIGRR